MSAVVTVDMKRVRYLGLTILTAVWLGLGQGLLWALPFEAPAAGGEAIPPVSISATTTEIRGVWLTNIDSPVLFSRKTVEQALQR
ncbi:MAG: hypothetical protein AAGG53_05430, partial [Cyanobacteria bacterium P01_H01_bin.152]